MALQLSTDVRDAIADAIETTVGTAPLLIISTGGPPANAAAADTGSVLATLTLPSDWLSAASSGAVSKAGAWSATASGTGAAAHFRLKDSTGTTTHLQGTVSATGGGGDLTLDNASLATGQTVTIATFTITTGNT